MSARRKEALRVEMVGEGMGAVRRLTEGLIRAQVETEAAESEQPAVTDTLVLGLMDGALWKAAANTGTVQAVLGWGEEQREELVGEAVKGLLAEEEGRALVALLAQAVERMAVTLAEKGKEAPEQVSEEGVGDTESGEGLGFTTKEMRALEEKFEQERRASEKMKEQWEQEREERDRRMEDLWTASEVRRDDDQRDLAHYLREVRR
jgi:hypothetical protein